MKIRKIMLVHHTHTDIGYTGVYPDVASAHIRHLRTVLDLCRRQPSFRWTVEAGWGLEMFLSVAGSKEKTELANRLRQGQIELTGFYNQPLTQLCSLEELCAAVELNYHLFKELPAAINTVMINDIGGLSYNAPQVLNFYGIRYVVNGCGGWRVMLPFTDLPRLFFLTGPDGSKVLYYHIGDDRVKRQQSLGPAQYGYGLIYFLWPLLKEIDREPVRLGDDGEKTILQLRGREGIDQLLGRLEGEGYPCDTLLIQIGTDNGGPLERLVEVIEYWNKNYGSPEIQLGTCDAFFRDIEARYGDLIPVVQGELTCSWSEHAITHAGATGFYREARRRLSDWTAMEACRRKPAGSDPHSDWWAIMKLLLLYSDHTFGLSMWQWEKKVETAGSIWDETFEKARRAWQIKAGYAIDALNAVHRLQDRQRIERTTDDPDQPQYLSLFNPHSFPAGGLVSFTTAQPSIELHGVDGSVLEVDSRAINTKWFLHKTWVDPATPYGVEVYRVCQAAKTRPPEYRCTNWELQGHSITVRVDPKTGGISSLQTTGNSHDWVDPSQGHLNEARYFHVTGIDPAPSWGGLDETPSLHPATINRIEKKGSWNGIHQASMLVEVRLTQGEHEILIETQYLLDRSGLHIRNRVRKIHTTDKEACYFVFPFRMERPFRFDVEQQGQLTRFPKERLSGSANHNFGIQDFVAVSDPSRHIVLTTLQACVVSLGKPDHYHFELNYHEIEHPAVFLYAFNNLWNTNCPLHQHGDLVFEYHLSCSDTPFRPEAAYKTSRVFCHPLQIFPGNFGDSGFALNKTNFLTLSSDTILVESIGPSADRTWRVRLVEISRRSTGCTVTLAAGRFHAYALQSDFRIPLEWQPIRDDRVFLGFRSCEFKTLLLRE
jgi:alpha-mannosidase